VINHVEMKEEDGDGARQDGDRAWRMKRDSE